MKIAKSVVVAAASSAAPSPIKSRTGTEQFAATATKTGAMTYKFMAVTVDGTYEGATDRTAGVSTGKITFEVQPGMNGRPSAQRRPRR